LAFEFFSTSVAEKVRPGVKYKAITSVAMLYDVDDIVQFMTDIKSILAPDGVWFTEQSHAAAILKDLCYDSICHEHATYLTMKVLSELAEHCGLRLLDTRSNRINGGSFSLLFSHKGSSHRPNTAALERLAQVEDDLGVDRDETWQSFGAKVAKHRKKFKKFLCDAYADGKRVLGYGASTKGNVLLQYSGVTPDLMPAIAERDPRKYGLMTPGTGIPIISESEARSMDPDVFVVFPWHFRDEIVAREQAFLDGGGRLLFPLPQFSFVTG